MQFIKKAEELEYVVSPIEDHLEVISLLKDFEDCNTLDQAHRSPLAACRDLSALRGSRQRRLRGVD